MRKSGCWSPRRSSSPPAKPLAPMMPIRTKIRFQLSGAASRHQVLPVHRRAEAVDRHLPAREGGMDKVAVPEVDGGVVQGFRDGEVETVAGLELVQGDGLTDLGLLAGAPGQLLAGGREAVLHEAAAVDSPRPVPAPDVRHP